MFDIEAYSRVTLVDGLIGYLEIRDWALEKISTTRPPANLADFRVHHYLYFANLFGAIDLVKDSLDPKGREAFEKTLTGKFPDPSDYPYARELRNSIVHRGLDPTASGIAEGPVVLALSPPYVFSIGAKKCYARRYPLLIDLARACDMAANAVIFETLERQGYFDEPLENPDHTAILSALAAAPHVPDWVPPLAEEAFETINLDATMSEVSRARMKLLRELLQA